MDHSAKLIAALVLSFAGSAQAFYANLPPPPGFAGTPGAWTYASTTADDVIGKVIHQSKALPVPGTAVKMPAAYRLAANAPRIAAAVIFAHPYVRVGVGIASWLGVAKVVYDVATGTWVQERPKTQGLEYSIAARSDSPWFTSPEAACRWYAGTFSAGSPTVNPDGSCSVVYTNPQGVEYPQGFSGINNRETLGGCPNGWRPSPAGCLSPALTQPQMVELLNPANQPGWPMPETVPKELPLGTPLPVEQPVINPAPGPNPEPRPLFVPTGDPVPNPKYDPNAPPSPTNQPYIQPGTRVVPSPAPSEPWRVDYQPLNRPTDNPDPNAQPNPDAEPGTNPADQPKPEEQQSLCEKHPDIVACAKLGEPGQATPVPNETKTLTIALENGFGPSGGSCPPPRTVQVAGLTLSMPFDLLCDFATGLKPVIVGLAWLTAAFTFMGIGRRS